ncbi:hypothetical protein ACFC4G_15740 [Streptomyces sp. NPDC056002]|uniref:hypothetical protein n=1 Tax=Streptomyces sp. NPDC056002 TaxID=3345675 RepID=UPI0035E20C7A
MGNPLLSLRQCHCSFSRLGSEEVSQACRFIRAPESELACTGLQSKDVVGEFIAFSIGKTAAATYHSSCPLQRVLCRRVSIKQLRTGLLPLLANPMKMFHCGLTLHLDERSFDSLRSADSRASHTRYSANCRANKCASRAHDAGNYPR